MAVHEAEAVEGRFEPKPETDADDEAEEPAEPPSSGSDPPSLDEAGEEVLGDGDDVAEIADLDDVEILHEEAEGDEAAQNPFAPDGRRRRKPIRGKGTAPFASVRRGSVTYSVSALAVSVLYAMVALGHWKTVTEIEQAYPGPSGRVGVCCSLLGSAGLAVSRKHQLGGRQLQWSLTPTGRALARSRGRTARALVIRAMANG